MTQPADDLRRELGDIDIYLLDQLLRGRITDGMRVLDAGCGRGRNLVYLLRRGFDVSATDASADAIEMTRSLAATLAPSSSGDRFRVEPVERMSFEDGAFDVVISSAVLHFAHDEAQWWAMLREMWRVLAPGGLFFVQGGPIWTSAVGHHVGVKGEKAHYRFGVPGANPIPPWAHLAHSRETLPATLVEQGVWAADAGLIAEFVYASPKLNRVGYRSMRDAFEASPLTAIDRIEAAFQSPPADMMARIARGPYAGQERYDVASITFVAS